jgi:hypothetical protein
VNVSVNHSALISNAGSPVLKVTNTIFEYSGPLPTNTANALFWVLGAGDWEFIGCTFTMSKTGESSGNVKLVYGGTGSPTISFASCQFTRVGQGTATLLDFAQFSTSSTVAMYDCTISDASTSAATQISTNQGLFIGQRIGMAAGRRVAINAVGQYCHFSKLTQTVASSDYCVVLTAGCTFVANNFTEAAGNTSGAINGTVAANILLANTSFQSANPFGAAASQQASIWIADAGGTYGNWQFIGRRGTISAQAVNRTGGEGYSLKFNMTSGSRNFLGCLQGFLNGLETILASLTTASTSIVIYGAHKGYSPAPDASQIWADCDYLDQATGARRAFASSRAAPGTALTADGSTWNGDTGLTPFKLVIPVAALQNCLAPIRIFGNLRQASAYFYIDPKPEVA